MSSQLQANQKQQENQLYYKNIEPQNKLNHIPIQNISPKIQSQYNEQSHNDQNQKQQQQKYKSVMKIYLKCVIICMGSFYMGYNIGVINLAYPKLEYEYGIQDNKELYKGILSSCLFLGATFGCILAGDILKNYGERKCTMICDIIAIILMIFYLIPNYSLSVVIRFLMGVILGINISTVSPFIKAISPTSILGKTGSFQGLFITSGVLVSVCIGQGYPIEQDDIENQNQIFWRFTLMFTILTCLIRFFSFTFIYKLNTPIYYIKHNELEKSKQALKEIYKQEYIQEQFDILKSNFDLQQLQQQQNQKNNQQDSIKSVFSQEYFNQIILAFALQGIFHLSGITAVQLYGNNIFQKTTGDKQVSQILNIGVNLIQVIPAFLNGELTKYKGRRPIILVGQSLQVVFLIPIGIITWVNKQDLEDENVPLFSSIFTISLIYIFCFMFRLTSGTITWTYCAEILTVKGNSIAASFHFFSAFVIGLLFPICVEQFGIHIMFLFFAVTLTLGIIFLYPKLKETKGLLPQEIKQLFNQNENKQKQIIQNKTNTNSVNELTQS